MVETSLHNKVAPTNDPSTLHRRPSSYGKRMSIAEREAERLEHLKLAKDLDDRVKAAASKMSSIYDPRTSKFLPQWDMVVGVALLFTATITPYEVAFLVFEDFDALFVFNRMFDVVFMYDIWVQFHLAFYDSTLRKWITDIHTIRKNYAKTWLLLDIVSTVPYDVIDVVVQKTSSGDGGGAAGNLKVLRVLKIMKLVKLLRILKSARIFVTMQRELGLTNSNAALIKFLATFLSFIHWIACIWGLGPQFGPGGIEKSWLTKWGWEANNITHMDRYALCIYTSVQMMVMGEAEDTRPVNTYEFTLAVCMMIIGGSVYAYVIGSICSLISQRDPAKQEFKDMCDLVAQFSYEHNLPQEVASDVRDYFRESEQLFRHFAYSKVVGRMAPSQRRAISVHLHGEALYKIWFFNSHDLKERAEFTAAVALVLHPSAFPPGELLYSAGHLASYMAIVTRGLATQSTGDVGHMKQLGKGAHFGEEMILSRSHRPDQVKAITYLNCNMLERDDLMRLLSEAHGAFPHTVALIRKATCKLALRRAVSSLAKMARLVRVTTAVNTGDKTAIDKAKWGKREVKDYKHSLMQTAKEKTALAMKNSSYKLKTGFAQIGGHHEDPGVKQSEEDLKKASMQLAKFTSPELLVHFRGHLERTEELTDAKAPSDAKSTTGPPLAIGQRLTMEADGISLEESMGTEGGIIGDGATSKHDWQPTSTTAMVKDSGTSANYDPNIAVLTMKMNNMESVVSKMAHSLEEQGNTLRAIFRDTHSLRTKL